MKPSISSLYQAIEIAQEIPPLLIGERSNPNGSKKFRECLLADDVDTGKAVLRDYINATIGFEELSQVFDKSSKSLMRMFGPKGNPQASNLFAVIHYLQEQEGIHLEVKARKVA